MAAPAILPRHRAVALASLRTAAACLAMSERLDQFTATDRVIVGAAQS